MDFNEVPIKTSIASLYNACIQSFTHLGRSLQSADYMLADQLSLPTLLDELGRFKAWAGNFGAHRSGRVSLDHRLREASHVREKVIELLEDLNRALEEGKMHSVVFALC
jgi:hypothetical protein